MVDASVAIKWVVSEPGTPEALALTARRLIAPALWRAECANILWKKVHRGEFTPAEAELATALLSHFPVELAQDEPDLVRILQLSLALDHPAYDCVYLGLAEALRIPLVTADRKLVKLGQSHSQTGGILHEVEIVPLMPDSPTAPEKSSV